MKNGREENILDICKIECSCDKKLYNTSLKIILPITLLKQLKGETVCKHWAEKSLPF